LLEGPSPESLPLRARVEIDLSALTRNFAQLARAVAPARLLPVVKAGAYGHGAVEVARTLWPLGPAGFGVARVEEGAELRLAGLDAAQVLVLSPVTAEEFDNLVRFELTPVLSSLADIDAMESFARAKGLRIAVHLKVDTGMHRLGVPSDDASEAMRRLRGSRHLIWVGLASHLADAEHRESLQNESQQRRFRDVVALLGSEERARIAIHFANSAAAQGLPATRHDIVRPGLALFGEAPPQGGLELEPVLALRARVLQVKEVGAGDQVGYGGRFVATRPTRVGIVGVGYADGYPWRAAGVAVALVRGARVALLGAVSMDLLAVDLTATGGGVGEEVTLIGRQGDEVVRVSELATWAGTIPYEVLCHLRLRLPRIWQSSDSGDEADAVASGAAEGSR
jgi:alanine racemase